MPPTGFVYSRFKARKGATARYTAVITQEDGATAIPAASLSSLTLTLIDDATGAVINSRSGQNVLNVNGVTVDSSGNLAWAMSPADNPIVAATLPHGRAELHLATFAWTWAGGAKGGSHSIWIEVEQNRNVS
jgi:hypothetical protein